MGTPQVRRIERTEIAAATDVLVRAFDDSPIMRHLMPSDALRARGTGAFFRSIVRDAQPFHEVWVAIDGPATVGAMVWLPPRCYPPTARRQVRQLLTLGTVAPGAPRALWRSLRYLRTVEHVHPKDEHWYLGLLGVDPSRQGSGIGTRLLDAVVPRIEADGRPAYLETDKERNLPYYARVRFELRDTVRPEADGPPTWTMWRSAATS